MSHASTNTIPTEYKNPFSVRGDSLYCPLAFSLDSFWNCCHNCHHCYFRRLNRTWGTDQRVVNPKVVYDTIRKGRENRNPKTHIAWALKNRTVIRFGNKSDPFQADELKYRVSGEILKILKELKQETVIQTRCSGVLEEYDHILAGGPFTYMPVISPGFEKDWEVLEKKGPSHPRERLAFGQRVAKFGLRWGVNGEPFIPGYHTPEDFETTIKLVKEAGCNRYNTYNFHFNDFVAKNLHSIGIDIERIWYYNQDAHWKPILVQLIDIAKKHDMILGCPDFVNSGHYIETSNTCCGLDVGTPCTFNAMNWKREINLKGRKDYSKIFLDSWDGIGDFWDGVDVFLGTTTGMYTLKDAGIVLTKEEQESFLKDIEDATR